MNYEIKPVDRRWRRKRGIAHVGVGSMGVSVEGASASNAAWNLARALFGERGRVESCVFQGRSHSNNYRGIVGKIWAVRIVASIRAADRIAGIGTEPAVSVWLTEGVVSEKDRPVGRFPRRPVDPVGVPDVARHQCGWLAKTAIEENLLNTVRERDEAIARMIAKHGRHYRVQHARQR